jgi:hypothetical protein
MLAGIKLLFANCGAQATGYIGGERVPARKIQPLDLASLLTHGHTPLPGARLSSIRTVLAYSTAAAAAAAAAVTRSTLTQTPHHTLGLMLVVNWSVARTPLAITRTPLALSPTYFGANGSTLRDASSWGTASTKAPQPESTRSLTFWGRFTQAPCNEAVWGFAAAHDFSTPLGAVDGSVAYYPDCSGRFGPSLEADVILADGGKVVLTRVQCLSRKLQLTTHPSAHTCIGTSAAHSHCFGGRSVCKLRVRRAEPSTRKSVHCCNVCRFQPKVGGRLREPDAALGRGLH